MTAVADQRAVTGRPEGQPRAAESRDPGPSTPSRRGLITASIFALGALALLIGLLQADAAELGEYGLVSVLSAPALLGAAVMVAAAVATVFVQPFDERITGAAVATTVAIISAAPAIVYDTARFSWAFKHVGIVDYLTRNGELDQSIEVLPIYHNWPGFFVGGASMTEWFGFDNAVAVATWAPLMLNMMTLLALVYLLGQFTTSRPTVWLAALLFFITNWIGQDYFSPQAVAFILYLIIIATTLRFYRRDAETPATLGIHVVMFVMLLTLAATHQLTPIVLGVALAGLIIWPGPINPWLPMVGLILAQVFWLGGWARTFVEENLSEELSSVGSPVDNAAETLAKAAERSDAQALVALAGRGLIVGIGLLAMFGILRRFVKRQPLSTAFILMAAPCGMVVLEFGGEILFRIVLFMLPVLCLLAAEVLIGLRRPPMRMLAATVVAVVCLAGFSLAYFGKDSFYTFTNDELAVVSQLMAEAPDNTLLVEGSRNYPSQFLEYEKFTYVAIEREDDTTQEKIARAPGDELYRWLSNPDFAEGYLLLTRSQHLAAEALGNLPPNYLIDIETALRSDGRFLIVLDAPGAVVFSAVDS